MYNALSGGSRQSNSYRTPHKSSLGLRQKLIPNGMENQKNGEKEKGWGAISEKVSNNICFDEFFCKIAGSKNAVLFISTKRMQKKWRKLKIENFSKTINIGICWLCKKTIKIFCFSRNKRQTGPSRLFFWN